MTDTDRFVVVFITAPNARDAEAMAHTLVEERLAACVNVVPGARSVYYWEGKIEHDDEVLMIVKSSRERFDELEQRVVELHSYDVPEVIAFDLTAISDGYLAFLRESLD